MHARDESRADRYFRHAMESHWDPYAIDLSRDRDAIDGLDRRAFTQLRATIAMFGAGEENVLEDLVPLAVAVDGEADRRFVASHVFEEARHVAFFERYWTERINPAEAARDLEPSVPTADRWIPDPYEEVFDRTAAAMQRLVGADTPENRARAYCHYHLTVEGILAQVGFHALQATFDPTTEGPSLPDLVRGLDAVRRDEGRHVGYGSAKLRELLASGRVDRALVEETVAGLADPVDAVAERMGWKRLPGPDGEDLAAYVTDRRAERLRQLEAENRDPKPRTTEGRSR